MRKPSRQSQYQTALRSMQHLASAALRIRPTFDVFISELRDSANETNKHAQTRYEREIVEAVRQTVYTVVADQAIVWRLRRIGDTGDGVSSIEDVPGWKEDSALRVAHRPPIEGRHVWPRRIGDTEDRPWSDWRPL